MKLTKEHIGQKFRKDRWLNPVTLIGFSSIQKCVVETCIGTFIEEENINWLPYNPQPKQEMKQWHLLMSPSIDSSMLGGIRLSRLQSDKPLRVALKNPLWIYPDGTMKTDDSVFEADLWIRVDGEK